MLAPAARSLATLLGDTAPLWRPAPFHGDPPWVHDLPALAASLLALDEAQVDALEADPDALAAWFGTHLAPIARLHAAADACLDPSPPPAAPPVPETSGRDVPGRKWQQLLHFTETCGMPRGPVVDWCSGKGHLGRLVARRHGTPVTCLERDAALCDAGAALARREHLPVQFVRADALQADAAQARLVPGTHALALHACGDLHTTLLALAASAQVAALDVAPCCYHLTAATRWQPLSGALAGCALEPLGLTRDDLRLAVQETVTSGASVVRRQRELATWRLAFDTLQRAVRGVDAYLPTPSRPLSVLAGGFPAFCTDLATHHGLVLPAGTDFAHHLKAGRVRAARVRRLELLRHACRRPLEVLLVADRALFLAERGYAVRVRRFCPRPLTPRNLVLQARLATGRPGAVHFAAPA